MKINSYQFGELEFSEENVINFESGLFGFENLKKYIFIKTQDNIFYWVNSVEQADIAFPLIGIRVIDENFPQEQGFEAFGIVTLNEDPLKVTVNLKAPVYINHDSKAGFQRILNDDNYLVKYNLFVE